MFKLKLASILMVLMLLLGAGSGTVFAVDSPSPAGSTETAEEQLLAIAKAALTAQNRVLVEDDVESVLLEDRLASSYQDSMRDHLVDALDRRKFLATHGVAYTGFDIELTVKRIQMTETTATMEAEVHTMLNLDQDDPLAPSTTEYVQDYRFTFARQGKRWTLTSAQQISRMGPVAPLPGASPIPEDVVPIDLDVSKPITSPPEDGAPVEPNLSLD
jgi:hypothetical protein